MPEVLRNIGKALLQISTGGALLVTGEGGKNVMTIGWAANGFLWGKNIMMVPVRKSRYSHGLLKGCREFTVFVPLDGFKKEIAVCGSKSGRDTDKTKLFAFKESGSVSVPCIEGKGYTFECRIVYETDMAKEAVDTGILQKYYSGPDNDNFHTLYFGEITAFYESE